MSSSPSPIPQSAIRNPQLDGPPPIRHPGREQITHPAQLSHKCAIESCQHLIQPGLLMCGRHWYMVPGRLRSAVVRTWREHTVYPKAYAAARQAAIDSVNKFLSFKK